MSEITEKVRIESWLKDASKPSLENLSYALRHPETWPKGFYWKFSNCERCAMGLAQALWHNIDSFNNRFLGAEAIASDMARQFAMPFGRVKDIFLGQGDWAPLKTTGFWWFKKHDTDMGAVTPEMVADQIDAYIASQK